jgi:hypothetical protein
MDIYIEPLLFSGVTNPRAKMSEEHVAELKSRMTQLKKKAGSPNRKHNDADVAIFRESNPADWLMGTGEPDGLVLSTHRGIVTVVGATWEHVDTYSDDIGLTDWLRDVAREYLPEYIDAIKINAVGELSNE